MIRRDHERRAIVLQLRHEPGDVGVYPGHDVAELLGVLAVLVGGLVDVWKMQDQKLGLVLLGKGYGFVHVVRRHVALITPRFEIRAEVLAAHPPVEIEGLEGVRSDHDGPQSLCESDIEYRLDRDGTVEPVSGHAADIGWGPGEDRGPGRIGQRRLRCDRHHVRAVSAQRTQCSHLSCSVGTETIHDHEHDSDRSCLLGRFLGRIAHGAGPGPLVITERGLIGDDLIPRVSSQYIGAICDT